MSLSVTTSVYAVWCTFSVLSSCISIFSPSATFCNGGILKKNWREKQLTIVSMVFLSRLVSRKVCPPMSIICRWVLIFEPGYYGFFRFLCSTCFWSWKFFHQSSVENFFNVDGCLFFEVFSSTLLTLLLMVSLPILIRFFVTTTPAFAAIFLISNLMVLLCWEVQRKLSWKSAKKIH